MPEPDETVNETKTMLEERLARERASSQSGRLIGGGQIPKGIFDQISLVAFVLDCNLRIMRFNNAAERLFGKRFGDVQGKAYFECVPVLSEINHDHAFQRAIALGAPAEVKEVSLVNLESRRQLFFDFEIDPILDEAGRLAGISVIGLDVTERVKLRRKLARQNEDLIALNQVSNALRRTMDLEKAFCIIASALTSQEGGGYDHAMIFLVDQERENIVGQIAVDSVGLRDAWAIWRDLTRHDGPLQKTLEATQPVLARRWGDLTKTVRQIKLPMNDSSSVLVHAVKTGHTVTQETRNEEGLSHLRLQPEVFKHFAMTSFAAAPLLTDTEAIGVVVVDSSSRPRKFSPERLTMLEMFANQAALAINNGIIFANVLDRAQRDSLTRLYNHGHFQDQLKIELERSRRYSYPVSLIMLDIDHFKKFNDNFGHQTGDLVLKQMALVLAAGLRVSDVVARYGGEEFAMLLPQTSHENAVELATRLCAGVSRKVVVQGPKGERLNVTASFGVATYPQHAAEPAALVSIADDALYAAKDQGRNRVVSANNLPPPGSTTVNLTSQTSSGTSVPAMSQTSAGTSVAPGPPTLDLSKTLPPPSSVRRIPRPSASSSDITQSFPTDAAGETESGETSVPATERERGGRKTFKVTDHLTPPKHRTDTMPPTMIELPRKSSHAETDRERPPTRAPRRSAKHKKK
ncbi:MAG: diguanylate cyclase [Planctomycetes bacterium]|nr:diguanylate cyclase [Planctomycetota bacterium]